MSAECNTQLYTPVTGKQVIRVRYLTQVCSGLEQKQKNVVRLSAWPDWRLYNGKCVVQVLQRCGRSPAGV